MNAIPSLSIKLQRSAYLLMRPMEKDERRISYGRWCHEFPLLLRAHGLAIALGGLAHAKPVRLGPVYALHICRLLHEQFPLPSMKPPSNANETNEWVTKFRTCPPAHYLIYSQLALTAADALKRFAESALGVDRDTALTPDEAEGDEENQNTETNHA